jgi:hypothetical protein
MNVDDDRGGHRHIYNNFAVSHQEEGLMDKFTTVTQENCDQFNQVTQENSGQFSGVTGSRHGM